MISRNNEKQNPRGSNKDIMPWVYIRSCQYRSVVTEAKYDLTTNIDVTDGRTKVQSVSWKT